MKKAACISPCRLYRYWLTRIWDDSLPTVCFVAYRPSTADATQDDAIIRKCVGFAKAQVLGEEQVFGGIDVLNLSAIRPNKTAADPIGPENGKYLTKRLPNSSLVIVAWGDLRKQKDELFRSQMLLGEMKKTLGIQPYCFGKKEKGFPNQVTRLSYDTPLERM